MQILRAVVIEKAVRESCRVNVWKQLIPNEDSTLEKHSVSICSIRNMLVRGVYIILFQGVSRGGGGKFNSRWHALLT